MSCPPLETIAAFCLGELDEGGERAFEEHYFECDDCFRRVEGVMAVLDQLKGALPPLLTRSRRELLERAVAPRVVHVAPGERAAITLGDRCPFGLWVLQAPLARAERVDFEALAPDGTPLFSVPDAPFDSERGEVVLACQLHYRGLFSAGGGDLHVRLSQVDAGGARPLAEYVLEHTYESS